MLLGVASLSAQSLETLDQQISRLNVQISAYAKEYAKLSQVNAQRLQKVEAAKAKSNAAEADAELKAAYESAEQLGQINARLNELNSQKSRLCDQWRIVYRSSMDDLLKQAEQEKDPKKKADAGHKLQQYQRRNAALCAEAYTEPVSQQWRLLKIEDYDGPQEIQQKIQLLYDISRELRISLAKLDTSYHYALREQRTKERAQEFIQEGSLFNDGSTMVASSTRSGSDVSTAGAGAVSTFSSEPASSRESGASQPVMLENWQSNDNPQLIDKDYQRNRTELLALQKELQAKIEDFQTKAKAFQIP